MFLTRVCVCVHACNITSTISLSVLTLQVDPLDNENFRRMLESWFLFCLIWSLGAGVDEDGRKKMDNFIREIEGQFPPKDTVYEYYVDTKTKSWVLWEEKLKGSWRYPSKYVALPDCASLNMFTDRQ